MSEPQEILRPGLVVRLEIGNVRLVEPDGDCWVCVRGRKVYPTSKRIQVRASILREAWADGLAEGVATKVGLDQEAYAARFHAKDRQTGCPDGLAAGLQWKRERGSQGSQL